MASNQQSQYVSMDQKKAQKQLEIARQAGTVPAEKDENGKDINPHMPKFLVNVPWYYEDSSKPSLRHQKFHKKEEKISMDNWYARGQRGYQATKYRKGACANCGAMTHKEKDCTERPRKNGAKVTGKDIKADEIVVEDLKFNWDSKRDRYNGYNPDIHMQSLEEHERYEALARLKAEETREQKKKKKEEEGEEFDSDEDKKEMYVKKVADYNSSLDDRAKNFRRQYGVVLNEDANYRYQMPLRCREDKANYLHNLDIDSAFYDPKSRALRDNPNPDLPEEQQKYKGLNYVSKTGEAAKIYQQEYFAWDRVQNKGSQLGSVSLPTATEQIFKQKESQEDSKKQEKINQLAAKYGGSGKNNLKSQQEIQFLSEQHKENKNKKKQDLDKIQEDENDQNEEDAEEILENYEKQKELEQQYNIKNLQRQTSQSKLKPSKYPEDQYENGHTCVWGSYYNDTLGWGYGCCWSTDRYTECEGERARKQVPIREYQHRKKMEEKIKQFESQKAQIIEEDDEEEEDEEEVQQEQQQVKVEQVKIEQQQNNDKEVEAQTQQQKQQKQKEIIKKESSDDSSESDSDDSSSDSSSDDSSSDSDDDSSDSSSSSDSDSSSEEEQIKKKNKVQQKADKKKKEKLKKLSEEEIKKQLKKQKEKEEEKKNKKQQQNKKDNNKRKYNSDREYKEITQKDIDEYHRTKKVHGDPMADYNDVD